MTKVIRINCGSQRREQIPRARQDQNNTHTPERVELSLDFQSNEVLLAKIT
jgi:hypothetical protein